MSLDRQCSDRAGGGDTGLKDYLRPMVRQYLNWPLGCKLSKLKVLGKRTFRHGNPAFGQRKIFGWFFAQIFVL